MTNTLKAAAAVILLSVTQSAMAQPPATPQPLADLMKIEGKWAGEAMLKLEGKSFNVHYTANFMKTADGSGMQMQEGFTHPELGTLVGENLIGYNNNDGKIHWFSVDNFGTAHEHLGSWKSPDHFFMEAREMQKGKKFIERIDMKHPNENTIDLHLVATLDGKVFEEVSCSFHRVNN